MAQEVLFSGFCLVLFNLIRQAIKLMLLKENSYHCFSNCSSCKTPQETQTIL